MPIVIKTVYSIRNYGANQKKFIEQHIDHLGIKRYITYVADNNHNTELSLIKNATNLEASLENNEIINSINSDDIVNYIQNPVHSTSKNIVKYIIRLIIEEKDIDLIINLKPVLLYLNANFTDIQLLSLLDITQLQLDKLRARVKDVYLAPLEPKSLEDIMEGFISLSESFNG